MLLTIWGIRCSELIHFVSEANSIIIISISLSSLVCFINIVSLSVFHKKKN